MNTIANLCRLGVLHLQAYAVAITIAGREDCLRCVQDPIAIANMQTAQDLAIGEHRRLMRRINQIRARLNQPRHGQQIAIQ